MSVWRLPFAGRPLSVEEANARTVRMLEAAREARADELSALKCPEQPSCFKHDWPPPSGRGNGKPKPSASECPECLAEVDARRSPEPVTVYADTDRRYTAEQLIKAEIVYRDKLSISQAEEAAALAYIDDQREKEIERDRRPRVPKGGGPVFNPATGRIENRGHSEAVRRAWRNKGGGWDEPDWPAIRAHVRREEMLRNGAGS